MDNWIEKTSLEELIKSNIIKLDRGRVISSIDLATKIGEYPVYSSSAQNNGHFGYYGLYDFDEELITWSVDGGGYFFYRPRHKFSVTNVSGILRILNTERINYKFVYYLFCFQHSNQIYDYVDKAHPSVIKKRYFVPTINVTEQQSIANILSKTDQAIAQTEALIAKYTRLKNGLMQDLLTKGIDEKGNIRSELTHEFKDSALGRIPKGWELVPLADLLLAPPKNGYSPKESDNYTGLKSLGLGCLTFEGFQPRQLKDMPINGIGWEKCILIEGDFLISRANTKEFVGLVGIYRDIGVPCIYPDLMMRLYFKENVVLPFIEYLMRFPLVRKQIKAMAVGTSESMVKISQKIVSSILVSLPERSEQERILNALKVQQNLMSEYNSELSKLQSLKTGLMQDLLSGKLRVNNLMKEKQ